MRKATTLLGVGLIIAVAVTSGCNLAQAQKCPSNPEALGTTRVLVIDPREYPRVGAMDHAVALPLTEKEVVLTFDDGPVPRYSNQILDILAAQCVKATFSWSEKWLVRTPQQCAGFSLKVIPSAPIAKIIPCALANCRPY